MTKKISGRVQGSFGVMRAPITAEDVRADPLLLVNSSEEDLRALFGELLEDPADVEVALELAGATRRVYLAALADPYDQGAEEAAVAELRDLWCQHEGSARGVPRLVVRPRDGRRRHNEEWIAAEPGTAAWKVLLVDWQIGGGTYQHTIWQALWRMLGEEANAVGRCSECGAFFRGRADRAYCGDACRMRATRRSR